VFGVIAQIKLLNPISTWMHHLLQHLKNSVTGTVGSVFVMSVQALSKNCESDY
jgi:hypothetical protein